MALSDFRKRILEGIKDRKQYLDYNGTLLDIYEGNLLEHMRTAMQASLSPEYFRAIQDRLLPINILQRYVNKVSTAYSKPPVRTSQIAQQQKFVDAYVPLLNLNGSGQIADTYSNLFKAFAWEPYIDLNKRPAMRELPFNQFMVFSTSEVSPELETIFVKFMGKRGDQNLYFAYTNEEFDAFWDDCSSANYYLAENKGVNLYGTIPYVYGKRQKNRLVPVQDTDMLPMAKALPIMLSDASGAQMFQAFAILYGIDVDSQGLKMSPNAFWTFRSDLKAQFRPQVGTIKPEADTDKICNMVLNAFVFWLETKGIRVGSVGQINAASFASGVSKVVDEMDVYEIKKRSIEWFTKDEACLWNHKLPKLHNHWIESGAVDPATVPAKIPDGEVMEIVTKFEEPQPMVTRTEKIANIKSEREIKTMTHKQAIKELHPEYTPEQIDEVIAATKLEI